MPTVIYPYTTSNIIKDLDFETFLKTIPPHIDNSFVTIKNISNLLQDCLNVIAPFFPEDGTDIVTQTLKTLFTPLSKYLKDFLMSSGSGIFIWPYNRVQKKQGLTSEMWEGISPISYELSPREAFQELFNSFYRKEDIYRPKWPNDGDVAGGIGLLLSTNLFTDLLKQIEVLTILFTEFINLSDYSKAITDIVKTYEESRANTKKNLEDLETPTENNSDPDPSPFEYISNATGIKEDLFKESQHWISLSLPLFVPDVLKVSESIQYFETFLTSLTQGASTLVSKFIKATKKKILVIENFANTILKIVDYLITLSPPLIGAYLIMIPPSTESPSSSIKGVEYLIDKIKKDVFPNVDINPILDAHKWSALLFATAGTGDINFASKIRDMFSNLEQLIISQASQSSLGPISFTVQPINETIIFERQGGNDLTIDNSQDTLQGTIQSIDQEKTVHFNVLCPTSTAENPVYYKWEVVKQGTSPSQSNSVSWIEKVIADGWNNGIPDSKYKLLKTNIDSFKTPLKSGDILKVQAFRRLESLGISQ